jgi:hypothetical protein
MRTSEWVQLVTFTALVVLAWLRPLERRRRRKATGLGALGTGSVLLASASGVVLSPLATSVLRDWLPAPLILVAYWQAGAFFTAPHVGFQEALRRLDERLLDSLPRRQLPSRWRRWLRGYLELVYLLCYPMLPLGLTALYWARMGEQADRYWTVVLVPTYLCYVLVPLLPTLPPRLLEQPEIAVPPPAGLRRINLAVLSGASIRANTFPSAHVTSTFGAALVLVTLMPAVGGVFLWFASTIAVATVVGRYHYLMDPVLAVLLSLVTFMLVG